MNNLRPFWKKFLDSHSTSTARLSTWKGTKNFSDLCSRTFWLSRRPIAKNVRWPMKISTERFRISREGIAARHNFMTPKSWKISKNFVFSSYAVRFLLNRTPIQPPFQINLIPLHISKKCWIISKLRVWNQTSWEIKSGPFMKNSGPWLRIWDDLRISTKEGSSWLRTLKKPTRIPNL